MPIAAFLLESAAPLLRNLLSAPVAQWHWILVTAEYSLLILFCLLNRKSWPVWILFAACVLNFFVIALYGFQMPVAPFAREIPQMAATIARIDLGRAVPLHRSQRNRSVLVSGRRDRDSAWRFGGLASVGDILLGLGSAALFCTWMLTNKPAETAQSNSREKRKTP